VRAFRRGALGVLVAAALIYVPGAAAAGVSVSYTITAGTPGDNGWYLSDVTIQLQVTGATDTTCPVVKTFKASTETLTCTATDGIAPITFGPVQFKIDKDKPTVSSAAADRQPNGNGWYNAPVTVSFSGSDPTSGIASCQQVSYSGPDSASAGASGTCRDNAGNVSSPFSYALKYDSTPPSVSPSAARAPDANGWYNHAVTVAFSGSDGISGVDSCTSASYGGPDASGASLSGSCSDKAGNSGSATFSLQYDGTQPTVTTVLERPPDSNGWYNHAVAAKITGADATSGLDTCAEASYSGPDTDAASLTGTCRDQAGNSASSSVSFKYDATAPKVTDLTVSAGNGTATLRWNAPANSSVTVLRDAVGKRSKGSTDKTVYHGAAHTFTDTKLTNGVRYRYTLAVADAAGNVAKAQTSAMPLALTSPPQGKVLKRPPLLVWSKVAGASYYNVQIFFEHHKVLSEWPVGTTLRLTRSWTWSGHKHTFARGRYRWYVWPGFGPRKASKYGKLLGGSFFVAS
jgi:hypothetical protein